MPPVPLFSNWRKQITQKVTTDEARNQGLRRWLFTSSDKTTGEASGKFSSGSTGKIPGASLGKTIGKKPRIRITVWSIILWMVVWQIASLIIGHDILLVSPIAALERLGYLAIQPSFWLTVTSSFLRIMTGFFLAMLSGVILATVAARYRRFGELIAPPLAFIKATPVASFIILILIWIKPADLALVISFLIVLPIVFNNVFEGIITTDPQLLEMAKVFRLSPARILRFIYLHQVMPFFTSACSVSLGLCWKAGIAAEIIGIPSNSIGERLYIAKLYLSTTDIFAWTVVIILVSLLFEKAFLAALALGTRRLQEARGLIGRKEDVDESGGHPGYESIVTEGLNKSFGPHIVFSSLDCCFEGGQTTALLAPSGAGKTTLLRILLGLESADGGNIRGLSGHAIRAVFQEDRLCENLSGRINCLITARHGVTAEQVDKLLGELGLDGHEHKAAREMSGGMCRRVALARALLAPGDILILDEPFKGLDDSLKASVIAQVVKYAASVTTIIVTHDKREAQALNARIVSLDE